jgi:signal transduction histidine kinase
MWPVLLPAGIGGFILRNVRVGLEPGVIALLQEVHLQGEAGGIELEVADRGTGFDVSDAKNNRGLGLVNMAERIHQVNGTFNIDSQPNAGTRIRARVPLAPKAFAKAAN